MESLSRQFADFWADAAYEDLPAEAIHSVKRVILDSLAVAAAGAWTDEGEIFRRGLCNGHDGGKGEALLWGTQSRVPASVAAIVNGSNAHILEMDDYGGSGHTGAVVVPAAVALAEREGASGRDLILAVAAGYDMSTRALAAVGGYAAHNGDGWHSTGTCGSFAAGVAGARMLRLPAPAFAHAIGIAGTFTGGIWAFAVEGAMAKRYHAGRAAESGVTGALLAQAGMTGPEQIFEAPFGGFLSSFAKGHNVPEALTAELGRAIRVEDCLKSHACCLGLYPPIDALLDLMRGRSLDWRRIERMEIHAPADYVALFDRPHASNLLEAQFSTQYCLAVAAMDGEAGIRQFQPLRIKDGDVARLMEATSVHLLDEGEARLVVHMADGETWRQPLPTVYPPVSDERLFAKVSSLLLDRLGDARVGRLCDRVMELEREENIRDLVNLLAIA
ncbi:MAG: MmgE/PrpD family protein [Sphingobium sp.]